MPLRTESRLHQHVAEHALPQVPQRTDLPTHAMMQSCIPPPPTGSPDALPVGTGCIKIVTRHDSTMWPPMYLKSKKLRFLPTRGLRGRGHAHPLINRRLVSQQAIRGGRLIQWRLGSRGRRGVHHDLPIQEVLIDPDRIEETLYTGVQSHVGGGKARGKVLAHA